LAGIPGQNTSISERLSERNLERFLRHSKCFTVLNMGQNRLLSFVLSVLVNVLKDVPKNRSDFAVLKIGQEGIQEFVPKGVLGI
jgi:hypothetical protein